MKKPASPPVSPGFRHAGLFLFILAAGVRLLMVGWGLPDVIEEAVPLRRAWEMWGWGPARSFTWNPGLFLYPSLMIYVQFLLQAILYGVLRLTGIVHSTLDFRILFLTDPEWFFVPARAVTALLGAGTAWLSYAIGRRVAGQLAGSIAGLIVALNPIHAASSVILGVDVTLIFFTALALYFCLGILESGDRRSYWLSGLAVGLAASSKYPGALLLAVVGTAHFIGARTQPVTDTVPAKVAQSSPGVSHRMTWLLEAFAVAGVVFLVTSPFVLLDWRGFVRDFSYNKEHMRLGHFGLQGKSWWAFYGDRLPARVLGWPVLIAALVGLFYGIVKRKRAVWVVGAAFLIFAGAALSWNALAERYVLPLVLPCALLAASLLGDSGPLSSTAFRRGWARILLTTLMAALFIAGPWRAFGDYSNLAKTSPKTEARRWIDSHVPGGCLIVSELQGPELLDALEIIPLEQEVRQRLLGGSRALSLYGVQYLPLHELRPELTAPYYSMDLYRAADYLVVAGIVRARYEAEPGRFAAHIAFYDSLEKRFTPAWRTAERVGSFPAVAVYRNPKQSTPFADRGSMAVPEPLRGADAPEFLDESFYWYNWAVVYEVFGFLPGALRCYQQALACRGYRPGVYANVASGTARCFLGLGRRDSALKFLLQAESEAPADNERAQIRSIRERLAEARP